MSFRPIKKAHTKQHHAQQGAYCEHWARSSKTTLEPRKALPSRNIEHSRLHTQKDVQYPWVPRSEMRRPVFSEFSQFLMSSALHSPHMLWRQYHLLDALRKNITTSPVSPIKPEDYSTSSHIFQTLKSHQSLHYHPCHIAFSPPNF